MRNVAGYELQVDREGCPSFPQSVERESRVFSQGTGFRLTTCRNDSFREISGHTSNQGFFLLRCCTAALLFCLVMVGLSNHAWAFNLPDTGQTKCYRDVSPYDEISCAGTGQDGAYNINPMSFTNNGNGTVTDNNTGLMWQRCSIGQNNDDTCSGTTQSYNWYRASGTYQSTYNPDSQDVCGDLVRGGYSDWRLPSKKELITIVDYAVPYPGPTINAAYFPNTSASHYWSSTTNAYNPYDAWLVDFGNGYVSSGYKHSPFYVRCVRGGQ
ncbi:MAG: DUF1566 domain-containing protein [Nitrospirae bacterium]|nr:DUF1566 domain-containing protein [Nitrospirota bacterium]